MRSRVSTFPMGVKERRLWGWGSADARVHLPNPSAAGPAAPGELGRVGGPGVEGSCLPGLGSYWVQGDLALALVLVDPHFAFTTPDLAWAQITEVEDIFPTVPWRATASRSISVAGIPGRT